jgi:hypothetical protein
VAPKDEATEPERKNPTTYDKVGKQTRVMDCRVLFGIAAIRGVNTSTPPTASITRLSGATRVSSASCLIGM